MSRRSARVFAACRGRVKPVIEAVLRKCGYVALGGGARIALAGAKHVAAATLQGENGTAAALLEPIRWLGSMRGCTLESISPTPCGILSHESR